MVVRAVWVISAVFIKWVYHRLVFHTTKRVAWVYLAIRRWFLDLRVVLDYLLLFAFKFFNWLVANVLEGCFASGYTFIRMGYLTVRQISIDLGIVWHQARFLFVPNINLVWALPEIEEVLILDVWFHFSIELLWSWITS